MKNYWNIVIILQEINNVSRYYTICYAIKHLFII